MTDQTKKTSQFKKQAENQTPFNLPTVGTGRKALYLHLEEKLLLKHLSGSGWALQLLEGS
ncbi:hypothetical protein KEJ13_09105 [Candidatus Bathyarchaeota archaeon]|nr:hypothetical protein [Candidatus Bathyarchaeota archaeon]